MVYKYNGIRNLILPEFPHLSMGTITRDNEDRAINAMKLFLETEVIALYTEPDNEYREMVHDNYVNCTFARGHLIQVTSEHIYLRNSTKTPLMITIDNIFDVIPSNNLKDKKDKKLKLFTFNSIDPTKPVDDYNILSTDPVRAFVSRDDFKTNPLYLFRIQELYSGMQFNTMRNDG